MTLYTTYIWPLVIVLIFILLAISLFYPRVSSPVLYSAISTIPWVTNCVYAVLYERRIRFLTIFPIAQVIVHIIIFLSFTARCSTYSPTLHCARAIFYPSISLACLVAIRRWGNPLYEILCLTATTEILTWITLLFILTLMRRS